MITLSPEVIDLLRRSTAPASPIYLVGGALRDAVLGRPIIDIDLATADARKAAARLAKTFRGTLVTLDETNAVYRIVLGAKGPAPKNQSILQIDVAQIQGKDILEDLKRRDFTLNALALPLAADLPEEIPFEKILDPRGGLTDIKKRILKTESEDVIKDDPLRILRAFRIAAQLDFSIEPKTLEFLRRNRTRVTRPAGERIQAELLALFSVPGCSRWIRLMDECEVLTALIDGLEPARQCAIVYYGPGGVLLHSLDTVARADFLLNNLGKVFPDLSAPIEASLAKKSQGAIPQKAVLILAALLHDIAKPDTAKQVDGRLRFFGHDIRGAKSAAAILKKFKFSREHIDTVSKVIAQHLRPGNLANGGPISDKAAYRFFRDMGDDAISLLLVCWADHASYLSETILAKVLKETLADPDAYDLSKIRPAEAGKTVHHLQVIGQLLRRHYQQPHKTAPERVITGLDVMKILRIPAGPEVGRILEQVREAQAEGKIQSRKDALAFLPRLKVK